MERGAIARWYSQNCQSCYWTPPPPNVDGKRIDVLVVPEDWRKRVGVEPTKSRLATLSGFEGQPPHRERFPSARDNGGSTKLCHRRTRLPAAGNLHRSPGVNPPVNSPRRMKIHAPITKIARAISAAARRTR